MTQSELFFLRTALVLLEEQHVTRAAARLHLSVSATSRALDRCRSAFGDPLLVPQGRNVVITPRGEEIRKRIPELLADIEELMSGHDEFVPGEIRQAFVMRASEAVLAIGAASFLELTKQEAPLARVQFEMEMADDIETLQTGSTAVAIGSYSAVPSDIRSEHLVDERLVAAVRADHPCLASNLTPRRFASLDHIVVSRRGLERGPTDRELAERGLRRNIAAVVPSFAAALGMAAQSDLIAIVPERLAQILGQPGGLQILQIPVPTPSVPISQHWHIRVDVDPAHMWFRSCVRRSTAMWRAA